MPRLFLRRTNLPFFLRYQAVLIAILWTGVASSLADPSDGAPPILAAFYGVVPIHVWGWIYLVVSIVLFLGLFGERFARGGLALAFAFLAVRFGYQGWQMFTILQDGAPLKEVLSTGSGLGILFGFVLCVFSMLMDSFTPINPTDPDVVVFRTSGGREKES